MTQPPDHEEDNGGRSESISASPLQLDSHCIRVIVHPSLTGSNVAATPGFQIGIRNVTPLA